MSVSITVSTLTETSNVCRNVGRYLSTYWISTRKAARSTISVYSRICRLRCSFSSSGTATAWLFLVLLSYSKRIVGYVRILVVAVPVSIWVPGTGGDPQWDKSHMNITSSDPPAFVCICLTTLIVAVAVVDSKDSYFNICTVRFYYYYFVK